MGLNKRFLSKLPTLQGMISNRFFYRRPDIMLKLVYAVALLICLLVGGVLTAKYLDRPIYAVREAELIAAQYLASDKALALAKALMQDYPQQCMPYEIAANVYSLRKNFSAAAATLQSAIDTCAAQPALYVRLAHFYHRTAPQKLNPWINSMLQRKKLKNSPTLAANLLASGGQRRQAIQYLEAVARTDAYSFEVCMMLSRLYNGRNQPSKSLALLKNFGESHELNPVKKAALLKEMFSVSLGFDRLQIDFCLRLIVQLAAVETSYVNCRKQLSENLETLMGFDTENHTEKLIAANLNHQTDRNLWIWLGAIFLQKIEKPQAAYVMLADFETTDARLLEEKARLSVHSGNLKQISRSWEALLKFFPNDSRIRLSYAQSLNRADFKAESLQVAVILSQTPIPENLRRSYFRLCFDNEAALKRYDALADTWFKAGKYYAYNDFLTFKDLIFYHLRDAEHCRRFLEVLQAKQPESSISVGTVELLRMFIAEQIGDEKLYFVAADAYLNSQSAYDTRMINTFIDSAIDQAALHHKRWKREAFQSQASKFAFKWSTILAEKHPDSLIYKSNRMISAYLAGQTLKLAEECRKQLIGNEKNHHQQQLMAGKLFRIGCFRLAAHHYQKALALQPDILRYRLNYAACLVKLHKYRQAKQIYIGLITWPADRTWNIKVLLQQLWLCYQNLQIIDDFPILIETLATDPAVDENSLCLAAGAVFLEKAQFHQAELILKKFILDSPSEEDRYSAYLKLANCYALQKKYDDAIDIYSTCLKKYPEDVLKCIDCLYNRAEMQRRKGAYQTAIEDWRLIAQRYPTDDLAPKALLKAASAARKEMHDPKQAEQIYAACLALAQRDKQILAVVREELEIIRKIE